MQKGNTMKKYSSEELRAKRGQSRTDWRKVDAMTEEELEQAILEEEGDSVPDWTKAELVVPQAKQSVHLRLEHEVIEFFKAGGKGHIARMQAVLKAYVDAHRHNAGR